MPDGLIDRIKAQAPVMLPSHAPTVPIDRQWLQTYVGNLAMQEPLLKLEPMMANAGQDVMDAWQVIRRYLATQASHAGQAVTNTVNDVKRMGK